MLSFDADRASHLDSVRALLRARRDEAASERARFFRPDESSVPAYEASLEPYRDALRRMLGWPLTEPFGETRAEFSLLRDDGAGRVYRMTWNPFGAVRAHGLFFLPPERGVYPLVLAQHGGLGSPELAAGFPEGDGANYNRLILGLLRRRVAVFAPQLLVWHHGQEPSFDQYLLDREFRHLGGSRAAMDLRTLRTALDVLSAHEEIDPDRIGMAGLSYGGFYTLFLSALDPRIRVAVSSCFANDRQRYNWEDWVWTGSALRFLDAEVARMVCPRPLFLEAGAKDEVFAPDGFPAVASAVGEAYRRLGLADRYHSRLHPGGHEYDPDGQAESFLLHWL